ncbi:MAG: hypothetical protein K6T67_12475, partial [Alicyclobacillus sp.]|nr:hypothetical protein [Alicyclobacillus sp.]
LRSIQVVLWHGASARGWEEDDYVDALEASLELEEPREAAIAALFAERRAVGGLDVRGSAAPVEASAGARPAADEADDSATEGADVPVVFDPSERTQTVLAAASGAREGGVSAAAHGGVSPAGQNGVSAAAHDGVSQDPEPAGGMASRAAEALTRQAEPPFAQAGEGEKAERDEDRRDRGRRPRPGRRRRRRGRTAGGGAEGAPADAPAAGSNGTAARAPGAGPVDVRPGAGPGQPPGLWRRPDSPGR